MNISWKNISESKFTKFIELRKNASVANDPRIHAIFSRMLKYEVLYFGLFTDEKLNAVSTAFISKNRIVQPFLLERQGLVFEEMSNLNERTISINLFLRHVRNFYKSIKLQQGENENTWQTAQKEKAISFIYHLPITNYHPQINKNLRKLISKFNLKESVPVHLAEDHLVMLKQTAIDNGFFSAKRWHDKVALVKTLHEGGFLDVFEVRANDKLMALACFITSNLAPKMELIQFLSGFDKDYANQNFSNFVFDNAYQYYGEKGFKFIDGGGASTPGIASFKKAMGAIERTNLNLTYYSNPLRRLLIYFSSKF